VKAWLQGNLQQRLWHQDMLSGHAGLEISLHEEVNSSAVSLAGFETAEQQDSLPIAS
jgi:hypothetical protein